MIITRTPLRVSLAGGGSDVPNFCAEELGQTVTVAIDKYVYVTVKREFTGRVLAHYRQTEDVATVAELRHDRMRACLRRAGIESGVEVASLADVPGSTGLGSSSAFTVGLLAALGRRDGGSAPFSAVTRAELAATACAVELGDCGAPIGRQDQHAVALGGVQHLTFSGDQVRAKRLECDVDALGQHLLLLYTGAARQGDAGQHIAAQRQRREDVRVLANIAAAVAGRVAQNNWQRVGELMHEAWLIKRKFVGTVPVLDAYRAARQAGAWGGKLCGAGGGGFLAFLAPPEAHAAIARATGLRAVPVRAGVVGCEVIHGA